MSSETSENTTLIDFLAWFEVNKKRLGAVLVLVVAGSAAYMVYSNVAEGKEAEAAKAVLALRVPMNAPTNAPQPSASAFAKVVADYQGTTAAEHAGLLGAAALFNEAKYAEAQAEFQKFLSSHPSSGFAGQAAFGVAASAEALGKADEAFKGYQMVVSGYGRTSVADDARMALARIHESRSQGEEALKLYDEVARPTSNSARGTEAMQYKEQLLKKYPALAKAAVPAAVGTNSPSKK